MSAGVGSVAAPDFAIHDRRTDGLLGAVVRGFDIREAEEGEELGGVAFQMFGEAFVIGIGSAEAGSTRSFVVSSSARSRNPARVCLRFRNSSRAINAC